MRRKSLQTGRLFFSELPSPHEYQWGGGRRLFHSWRLNAGSVPLPDNAALFVFMWRRRDVDPYSFRAGASHTAPWHRQRQKGGREREEDFEIEGQKAWVIFVSNACRRGALTQINRGTQTHADNRVSVNASPRLVGRALLWRQLSGHTACRSHRWLPWIITIMNVKGRTHRPLQKIAHDCSQDNHTDCRLLEINMRLVRFVDMWHTKIHCQ